VFIANLPLVMPCIFLLDFCHQFVVKLSTNVRFSVPVAHFMSKF